MLKDESGPGWFVQKCSLICGLMVVPDNNPQVDGHETYTVVKEENGFQVGDRVIFTQLQRGGFYIPVRAQYAKHHQMAREICGGGE